jgi:ribosome recycling factor
MVETPGNVISIIKDMNQKMDKSLEATTKEFGNLRTGRANIHLVENIQVLYYNTPTPLKQLASISTPDAKTIAISPWDASQIKHIETAIQKSDLGLTPNNDGKVVRVQVPPLTEERRNELVKLTKKIAEEGRVSIRGARHEAVDKIKKLEKDHQIPEDESRKKQKDIQVATDGHIKRLDDALAKKEGEITQV